MQPNMQNYSGKINGLIRFHKGEENTCILLLLLVLMAVTLWSFGTNYADSVFSNTIYKFTQGKRKYNQDWINMGLKWE